MPPALSNAEPGPMSKPPGLSKLLILLGAISILTPFSLDMYLPALPAIARDLKTTAGAVELTLPSFFAGLALSQLLFGSLADHQVLADKPVGCWAAGKFNLRFA